MPALAEWWIELQAKGGMTAQQEIETIKKKLEEAEGPAQKMRKRMEELERPAQQAAEAAKRAAAAHEQLAHTIGNRVAIAAHLATAAIMGIAKAGLAGTQLGDRLSISFNKFAQEVAGVLGPVFEMVIDLLKTITDWMKKLSGSGQVAVLALTAVIITALGAIAIWLGAATAGISLIVSGVIGLVAALYKVVGSTEAGRNAFQQIREAIGRIVDAAMPLLNRAMEVFSKLMERIGPIIESGLVHALTQAAKMIELVVKAMEKVEAMIERNPLLKAALMAATMGGIGGQGGKSTVARTDMTRSGGQFEDVTAAWKRLQGTALKTDDPAAKALKVQEEIRDEGKKQTGLLERVVKQALLGPLAAFSS